MEGRIMFENRELMPCGVIKTAVSTACVSTDIGSRVFCAHSTAIGTQDGIPSMSFRDEQLSHELVICPFSSIET